MNVIKDLGVIFDPDLSFFSILSWEDKQSLCNAGDHKGKLYVLIRGKLKLKLGTCESFFSFESNIESNRPYIYHSSRNTAWRTASVPYRPIICWRLALWTNGNDVRNWVLVHFNSVLKRVKQWPLYAYLTPKVDFKRKFNHNQSFLYEWRLTARTIRKFRIGPSLRIESRIGRTIRNRIESRSFAGP